MSCESALLEVSVFKDLSVCVCWGHVYVCNNLKYCSLIKV